MPPSYPIMWEHVAIRQPFVRSTLVALSRPCQQIIFCCCRSLRAHVLGLRRCRFCLPVLSQSDLQRLMSTCADLELMYN